MFAQRNLEIVIPEPAIAPPVFTQKFPANRFPQIRT